MRIKEKTLALNLSAMIPSFLKPKSVAPTKEAGVSGMNVIAGYIVDREKNQNLTYLQRTNKYEEIIANLAVVGAGVRYFTALGTSAKWTIEANENDTSGEYAEITEKMMEKLDQSWSSVVSKAINYRWFGYSVQEWTAMRDKEDGTIFFKSIENRPQRTIEQFDVDDVGNVNGFGQRNPVGGDYLYIPRKKTIYIVDDIFSDSPAGLGVLRHVYESCDRLSNYLDLEKQGFERNLRNIPIGRVPYMELQKAVANGDITEDQMKAAVAAFENLVSLARKQSTTGLIMDSSPYWSRTDTGINVSANPQWDITLLQGSPSDGQQEIDAAIQRVQTEIARVLGSEGMMLDGAGSNAMAKEKNAALYLNINSCMQDIRFCFNKDIIDPFWKLNGFPDEMKPCFKVEDVNQQDAEVTAKVLSDLATAGAPLSPDDDVINDLRDMLGVSQVDLEAAMERVLQTEENEQATFEMEQETAAVNNKATEIKARADARKPASPKK